MRLDAYLVEIGMFLTRTKAKQAIERGEIIVDGKPVLKSAYDIKQGREYAIKRVCAESYVSLGGYKLSKALRDFGLSVSGLVAADIGASTGGFTDCLLQNGAKAVYAVDVNDNLLDSSLKSDVRVKAIIKNCKNLTANDFADKIDILTADLSFISETVTLPVFYNILEQDCIAAILIKPQFENNCRINFKNGIIRDKNIILKAIRRVFDCAVDCGFLPIDITIAPLFEDKNREFIFLLKKAIGTVPEFSKFISKIYSI